MRLSKVHNCLGVMLPQAPHLGQPALPLMSLTQQFWQQQHKPVSERG
jgi:hypothetical protein